MSAKERKALVAIKAAAEHAVQAEAASWEDSDKVNKAKSKRLADKDAKSDAKLQSKQERKALEAVEEQESAKATGKKDTGGPQKVTQWEIAQRQGLLLAAAPKSETQARCSVDQPRLQKNTNHMEDVIIASGIDAALGVLDRGFVDKDRRPSTTSLSTVASVNDVGGRRRRGHGRGQ